LPQEVDIAVGSITITGSRSTVVDFPISYYETPSGAEPSP
jgi:ABC-type amino acid transport substrate-binding protein